MTNDYKDIDANPHIPGKIVINERGIRTDDLFIKMDKISSLEIIDRSLAGKSVDAAGALLPAAALFTGGLALIPALIAMAASRFFVESTFQPWLRIHLLGGGYHDIQGEFFGISIDDLQAIKSEIENKLQSN